MCLWGKRVCVVFNKVCSKQHWHHVTASEIVRHRLCPKMPLPSNTHTCTNTPLKLSFLIEMLHSLPCKHPASAAGVNTVSTSSPQSASEEPPTPSANMHSCPHVTCCVYPAGSQESDSSQTAKKDMLAALRARQDALEETLRQRLEELKSICIREAVCENKGKLFKYFEKQNTVVLFLSNLIYFLVLILPCLGADRKASKGISSGSGRRATHSEAEDRDCLQTWWAENSS